MKFLWMTLILTNLVNGFSPYFIPKQAFRLRSSLNPLSSHPASTSQSCGKNIKYNYII